jgi:hypothetical protein
MKSFSESLAAAKAAPRKFEDVTVSLDEEFATRRAELSEQLDAARANSDQRLAAKSPADLIQEQIDELLGLAADSLVTLRFYRMGGDAWSDIAARAGAPRDGAGVDGFVGFNVQAAAKLAAPFSGVRLDGDEEVKLIVAPRTDDEPAVDEWADLWVTLSGTEVDQIEAAILIVNVIGPQTRVAELKNILATRPA